jgi:hypothetical protein
MLATGEKIGGPCIFNLMKNMESQIVIYQSPQFKQIHCKIWEYT